MPLALLQVDGIDVFYADLQVLWNISLEVFEEELVALLGSNGAGKTTTLRSITGLLKPRSGQILFLGRRIEDLTPHEIVDLGIAHVPEGRRIFPPMTVLENLELGAFTKNARKKKDDSLEFVYSIFPVLKERRNQVAGTLSGGEQQMLAIGRALMSRPKLLLLDEPSLGLAPKVVRKTFEILAEINKNGVTILLVEQSVRNALELSKRSYVIETGKIVLYGDSRKLLEDQEVRKAYLGVS